MSEPTKDPRRVAFEAWVNDALKGLSLTKHVSGNYKNTTAKAYWEVWQACYQAAWTDCLNANQPAPDAPHPAAPGPHPEEPENEYLPVMTAVPFHLHADRSLGPRTLKNPADITVSWREHEVRFIVVLKKNPNALKPEEAGAAQ